MATTNLQIMTSALRKAGICDETLSPSNVQQTNALLVMNGYLLMRQAADSLRLGWYTQTDPNANAPLRDECVYPVILLLANQLASDSGQPIQDPSLIEEIKKADAALMKLARLTVESDLGELSRAQAGAWGGASGWTT